MVANGIKNVDLEKAARAAANWISSEEGQKAIEKAVEKSREIKKILDEAHRVDPKVLDIRFTI
jgi:hypothetical protein